MKNKKGMAVTRDFIYCIGALGIMNCVLQFAVYPYINRVLGSDTFGDVLYLLGIIAIFAPALGLAANNTRLVERNKYDVKNGDVNIILGIFSIAAAAAGGVIFFAKVKSPAGLILWSAVIVLTTLRYYSDVEFRLVINYKKYFVYYVILSVFYLVGIGVFYFTKNWLYIFLIGELAAVLYVILCGTIYKKPFEAGEHTKIFAKSTIMLALAYLIYNFVLNVDRIIISHFIGSVAVSEYYVVSLIGKTIAILISSLNSLIIGYLTNSDKTLSRKTFLRMVAVVTIVGAAFFIACLIVTPIFIRLLYPNMYESTAPLIAIVSVSQIFCFLSSVILTIVLTVCSSKWQLIVQSIYGVLFIVFGCLTAKSGNLFVFSIAALVVNALRYIMVCVLGVLKTGRNNIKYVTDTTEGIK